MPKASKPSGRPTRGSRKLRSNTGATVSTEPAGDVALLVDWENLKISLGKVGLTPNVTALYEASRDFGRVVVARAYMDWLERGMQDDPHALYRAGVEPVYVPKRRFPAPRSEQETDRSPIVKNSVDVRMAVDATTLCHTNPNIETFVLVSGDQDFLHVVNALRPFGRRVILIGVTVSLSQQLAEFVDEVIFYDRDIEGPPEKEGAAELSKETPDLKVVFEAIRDILENSSTPGVGLFSFVGLELKKRCPEYSPRTYGFKSFRRLMEAAREKGYVAGFETRGLQDWAYLGGYEETLRNLLRELGGGAAATE